MHSLSSGQATAIQVEILAYMIYSEGPGDPEHVMHVFYLEIVGPPQSEDVG